MVKKILKSEEAKTTFWTAASAGLDQSAPYLQTLGGGIAGLAIAPVLINRTSNQMEEHAEELFEGVSPAKKGVVLGMATSFPEIAASFFATLRDQTEAANANVQGSNIVNTLSLLAIHSIFSLKSGRWLSFPDDSTTKTGVKYGAIAAATFLGASALTLAAPAAAVTLGISANLAAGVVASAFIGTSALIMRSYFKATGQSSDDTSENAQQSEPFWTRNRVKSAIWTGVSLGGLMMAASAFVTGGVTTATVLGASAATIGLIYAVGTSIPEMMVMWNSYSKADKLEKAGLSEAAQRERGTAVGNVLGSNIFNPLAVGPVMAATSIGSNLVTGSAITLGAGFLTGSFGIALATGFVACPLVLASLVYFQKKPTQSAAQDQSASQEPAQTKNAGAQANAAP